MARGRKANPKRVWYWSEQHKALLASLACKEISRYPQGFFDIDEIINATWITGLRWRSPDQLHGCGSNSRRFMRTYLQRCWRQMTVRYLTTHSHVRLKRLGDEDVRYQVGSLACPHSMIEQIEISDELESVWSHLGSEDRDLLRLRYLEEMSMADIGRRIGMTREGVRWKVNRALGRARAIAVAITRN